MKKWAYDLKNTKNHVFGVKYSFFSSEKSISYVRIDDKSVTGSNQRKKMGMFHQKMAS